MSTQAFTIDRLGSLPSLQQRHSQWFRTTVIMVALTLVCAGLLYIDERTLNGVSVWTKPFKFSLSLAVYFATLAWFAPLMPADYFATARGRVLTWVPIACGVFEMAYIIFQAGQGQHSHFNVNTPFHATMYSLMGGGAALLVAMCLWMGVTILRVHGTRDPFVLAVGLGLIATFVLGGGFGGYLGSQTGHWVGGTASDAQGLTLVRWSRDGGDLRVAHFFGMHAMQVLPLLGALIQATVARRTGVILVVLATLAYGALTAWTFVQALRGVPFLG